MLLLVALLGALLSSFDPLPVHATYATILDGPGGGRDQVYPSGSGTTFGMNTFLDTLLVSASGTMTRYDGSGSSGSSSAVYPSCLTPSGVERIVTLENLVCGFSAAIMCCGRKANRWSSSFTEELLYNMGGGTVYSYSSRLVVANNTFFAPTNAGIMSRIVNATHLADPTYLDTSLCTGATVPEDLAVTASGSHVVFWNSGLGGPSLFSLELAPNGSTLSCSSWTGDASNTCATGSVTTMRTFDWDKVVMMCDDVVSGGNSTIYLTQSSGSTFTMLNQTKLHPTSSDYEMLEAPGFGFPFYTTFGSRLESYALSGTQLTLRDDLPTSTRTANNGLAIPPSMTHLFFGSTYFLHPRQVDIWTREVATPTIFDPPPNSSPPSLFGGSAWNLTFNATTTPSRYCYITIACLDDRFQVQRLYDLSPCTLGMNSRPMPLLDSGSYFLELWVVGSSEAEQPAPTYTWFGIDAETTMVTATVMPGGSNTSMMMDGQLTFLMAYALSSDYTLSVSAPLEDGTLYLFANSSILLGTLAMTFNETGFLTLDPETPDGLYTQLTLTFEDSMGNRASALLLEAPQMMIQAVAPDLSGGTGTGDPGDGTGTGEVGPPPSGGDGTGDAEPPPSGGDGESGSGTGIEGDGTGTGGTGTGIEGTGDGTGMAGEERTMSYASSKLGSITIGLLAGVGAAIVVVVLAVLCLGPAASPVADTFIGAPPPPSLYPTF